MQMVKYSDVQWDDGLDSQMLWSILKKTVDEDKRKIVVLDDDPTGVQTVHDIPVYTDWSLESIRQGFLEPGKLFFILTNSRSFTAEQTEKVHHDIASRLIKVSKETGVEMLVISRGDSTLRGHYPLETETLKDVFERCGDSKIHGEIICPFFASGGRYTIENVQYVRDKDFLIPVGETEFAKDKTFGYCSSDLREYIEEKTGGRYKKERVICISEEQLRSMDFDGIENALMDVDDFQKVIVNALTAQELQVFCIALYRVMARGKKFLFRTAADFVREIAAISHKNLLTRSELIKEKRHCAGLIVIGSHTQKTNTQLAYLKKIPNVCFVEFDSDKVLNSKELEDEIVNTISKEDACIKNGITAVVYTKRQVLSLEGDTPEQALQRSVKISEAVQNLVGQLQTIPDFIIAKGGITSSDIGIKALGVKRAWVQGQIQPGVPVWKLGEESKFPQIPYVIFPGNVGEETTLRNVLKVFLD
jgi:uncharacterized protein YgbK (DUF1537 family)